MGYNSNFHLGVLSHSQTPEGQNRGQLMAHHWFIPGLLLHLPTALQSEDDGLLVVDPKNIIPADLGLVVVAVVVDKVDAK